MLTEFGVWAIAVDIGHHAIAETEIDTIPFGPFHIGAAYTIQNAEVTDTALHAVIDGAFSNGRGNVLAIFDVVDVDGVSLTGDYRVVFFFFVPLFPGDRKRPRLASSLHRGQITYVEGYRLVPNPGEGAVDRQIQKGQHPLVI